MALIVKALDTDVLNHRRTLTLVCVKCTYQQIVTGIDDQDAAERGKQAGWKLKPSGKFVCPKCP